MPICSGEKKLQNAICIYNKIIQWYEQALSTFEINQKILELMKAGYPPIDIKFTDRLAYYNAFDEYHVKGKISTMENLFAGYIEARLGRYMKILED